MTRYLGKRDKFTFWLKHHLRSGLDQAAAATGLLQICERSMRRGLTILMYHRILPPVQCRDYPLASLVMPVDVFRRQMQWLSAHYRVLPVREAVAELTDGGPFKFPLAAVTFDDGYADNFETAAPIMEEQGLRGTFFITSGFVARGRPLWYDRAAVSWQQLATTERQKLLALPASTPHISTWMARLKQESPHRRMQLVTRAESLATNLNFDQFRPMTSEQVAILHQRGHEIASHTVSHPILPQLADDELKQELKQSAEQLSMWINDKVTGFCYPNGDRNNRVERAVEETGYNYACTTQSGFNRPSVCLNRLQRLPITIQRTTRSDCSHDALGFRAELCRLREWWR